MARELFFGPETIDYMLQWANGFILLSLLGTLCLMISVVALVNAKILLQVAWGASYIVLNVTHWIAAALPRKLNWDFSSYEIVEQGISGGPRCQSFTEGLSKAIFVTEDVRWVKNSGSAPQTTVWDEWLLEVEEKSREYGHFFRVLIDPIERGARGDEGVIWDMPRDWDWKEAWNRINRAQSSAAAV